MMPFHNIEKKSNILDRVQNRVTTFNIKSYYFTSIEKYNTILYFLVTISFQCYLHECSIYNNKLSLIGYGNAISTVSLCVCLSVCVQMLMTHVSATLSCICDKYFSELNPGYGKLIFASTQTPNKALFITLGTP